MPFLSPNQQYESTEEYRLVEKKNSRKAEVIRSTINTFGNKKHHKLNIPVNIYMFNHGSFIFQAAAIQRRRATCNSMLVLWYLLAVNFTMVIQNQVTQECRSMIF